MPVRYTVSIPQMPALQKAFDQAPDTTKLYAGQAANKALVTYQRTAKMLAPIDTGLLRASIQIRPFSWRGSKGSGSVGTNNQYALAQEQGTGIYGPKKRPITPKTKPMLAWYAGGKWHFAKSVKGTRPKWFMRSSLEQNQSLTNRYFGDALRNVTEAMKGAAQR